MLIKDRFLNYIKVETQSNEDSSTTPSSANQFNLLELLKVELVQLGLKVELDKYGRLYGFLEGNNNYSAIGFNAHVDTASELTTIGIKPQIISNYDGLTIPLSDSGYILDPKNFPILNKFRGKTLITTSGNTLLGADDKAGIAIIMEALTKLVAVEKNARRPMYVLFTPDEEIGRGSEHFDIIKFAPKFAYTIDGAEPNLINIENFNAASVKLHIEGVAIHPGDAFKTLENAITVGNKFISFLPEKELPELTKDHEGFYMINSFNGSSESAELSFIVRDHDKAKLEKRLNAFKIAYETVKTIYSKSSITMDIKYQYKNMLEVIKSCPEATKTIERVFKKMNIDFSYEPIRGGTDGASFSFLGVPTPNLGTGSYNHHGRFEFAVIEEMELMSNIVINIIKI